MNPSRQVQTEPPSPPARPAVMAESRRVQLTTLSCDVALPSDTASAPKPPAGVPLGGGERAERRAESGTVRLALNLFEPDDRSFPEFSFCQLVDNQINQTEDEGPLSRLEEEEEGENDEVAAIAKRLEEKYGGKPKKKKDRIQDLIDIGHGYDDEDSFIDNSEAYDEFVPASITTKFGGFYVNSGVLQFRQASDTEADDLTPEEKSLEPTKKRRLNGRQDKPKKKLCRAAEKMKSSMDPNLSTLSKIGPANEMKVKKKKKVVRTLSVTSMLKKFQREKETERQRMEKETQETAANTVDESTLPMFPADAGGGGGSGLTDPLLSLIGSTNDHALIQAASTVDFDIDLDSLLDVTEETSSPKSLPQPATEVIQTKPDDQTRLYICSDVKAQTPNTKNSSQPHPEQVQLLSDTSSTSAYWCAPLPEGLPPGLEESIRKLMVAAKMSGRESKLKFFNPDINSILLDIELQCREQGGPLRSKVYTHLSPYLPCSRDTLLKRVKKLLTTHLEEPSVMEDPMMKLREAIGRSMPEQMASFRENCQAYEQVKTSKATEEDNVEEKGGRRGGPRKWFKWNEEIRECLGHVLRDKMDKYEKERKGRQEIEKHLKIFLDNEIKPLWPKGWIQSRVLIRQSRSLLGLFTSLPVKKAKSEKKQSSVSGASTLSDGCDSLQGTRSLTGELPAGTDHVLTEGTFVQKEGAALKKGGVKKAVELDDGLAEPAESDTHSLLDLLADQALAQEQPLTISQELLAEAVEKYKHSFQHWSFGVSTKSPPLPPPPPQSSPVSVPVSRASQVVLPQLQPAGNATHEDAAEVHVISDDHDFIVIE